MNLLTKFFLITIMVLPGFTIAQETVKTEKTEGITTVMSMLHDIIIEADSLPKNINSSIDSLLREYDLLATKVNGIHLVIAKTIATRYFPNIANIKNRHGEDFSDYATEGYLLHLEIAKEIDRINKSTKYQTKHAELLTISATITAGGIIYVIKLLLEKLEKRNCISASIYYENSRWLKTKELRQGKRENSNWNLLLGEKCEDAINKKQE